MSRLNATAVIFNMKEPIYRKLVKWEVRRNGEKQGKLQSTRTLPMEWKCVERPGRLEEHCLNEEGYPCVNTVEMGVNMHICIAQCRLCTGQNNREQLRVLHWNGNSLVLKYSPFYFRSLKHIHVHFRVEFKENLWLVSAGKNTLSAYFTVDFFFPVLCKTIFVNLTFVFAFTDPKSNYLHISTKRSQWQNLSLHYPTYTCARVYVHSV